MFEPVYMAWDIYDGPRTGLVRFLGLPHYFACRMAAEGGRVCAVGCISRSLRKFRQRLSMLSVLLTACV